MEVTMKKAHGRVDPLLWVLLLVSALLLPAPVYAGNDVMGEIQFEGKSHVEKTSGVWVDGAYVGYLKELKGSKKVLFLPGEHVTLRFRQALPAISKLDIDCRGDEATQLLSYAVFKRVVWELW